MYSMCIARIRMILKSFFDICRSKGGDLATLETDEEWKNIFRTLNRSPDNRESIEPIGANDDAANSAGVNRQLETKILWINGIFSLDLETFQMKYVWVRIEHVWYITPNERCVPSPSVPRRVAFTT